MTREERLLVWIPKAGALPLSFSQVPQRSFPKFNMEVSIFLIYFLKVPKKLLRSMHISQGHNLSSILRAFPHFSPNEQ